MIMKWIICTVHEEKKQLFSKAQEEWAGIKNLDGFLGQVGGWNTHQPLEACIITFWKDYQSYQSFMKYQHDAIFEKGKQRGTYESISIDFYHKVLNINNRELIQHLSKGKLLRIADCIVHKEKQEQFIQKQKEIWNMGMGNYHGMLAGAFSVNEKQENRFLVASIWEDRKSHQEYVKNKLPSLLAQSHIEEDVIQITGKVVELEDSWFI